MPLKATSLTFHAIDYQHHFAQAPLTLSSYSTSPTAQVPVTLPASNSPSSSSNHIPLKLLFCCGGASWSPAPSGQILPSTRDSKDTHTRTDNKQVLGQRVSRALPLPRCYAPPIDRLAIWHPFYTIPLQNPCAKLLCWPCIIGDDCSLRDHMWLMPFETLSLLQLHLL